MMDIEENTTPSMLQTENINENDSSSLNLSDTSLPVNNEIQSLKIDKNEENLTDDIPSPTSPSNEDDWLDIMGSGNFKKLIIKKGSGHETRPEKGDQVTVGLTCFANDMLIEKHENLLLVVGDMDVIQGIDLVLCLMEKDEVAKVKIPAKLAYGKLGRSPDIPPNSDLEYEIHLKDVQSIDQSSLSVLERLKLGKMEWNSKQILKLIAEYRERPSLWNIKIPQYTDKYVRKKALTEIAMNLDTSIDYIRKKINILRSQYLVEQKKVLDSRSSGAGYDSVYEPQWAYYKELDFLKDCTFPGESRSNLKNPNKELFDNELTDEDSGLESNMIQDTLRNHDSPRLQTLSKKRKLAPVNELMAQAMSAIANVSKKDDLDAFGAYIASELRTLTPDSQTLAKNWIFKTLRKFKLNQN